MLEANDMEWRSMLNSTVPSEWARNLVRGAYDLHAHVAPDVMRLRVTDVQLARRCWDAGVAGFVLKSHYVPTAERAAVVNEALGGEVQVLGALALNATHPDFPQQDMSLDDQLALARQGVFLERCFCPPYTGMCDWARMVANIRATGPASAIVTTDLGQPDNPPVEDGLALMADALHAKGFTDEEITTMIVDNSLLLAGADALRADPRRM